MYNETTKIDQKFLGLSLKETVERASLLSLILAPIFLAYSFISIDFIQRFLPQVQLWDNLWPRFLFNFLPLLALGLFLPKARWKDSKKLYFWIVSFSVVLHSSGWIYVWQIALNGSPQIMTYVHAANTYIFAVVYASVAPPRRFLIPFTTIFCGVFVIPLCAVAYVSGDSVIFYLTVGDSILALTCSITLSRAIDKLRTQIARLEMEREETASKFLGPVVSQAIYNGDKNLLKDTRCRGFIITLDIRDSTEFQKLLGDRWYTFRKEYFAMASQIVNDHGGYIQKTVGDCHVVNFGVFNFEVDLSGIPGIEEEIQRAESRRLQRASDSAFLCMDRLFSMFQDIAIKYFQDSPIRLGGGIDMGLVERGIQELGNQHYELDVNGDPVNCSNRLQDYAKAIANHFQEGSSLLVVSPYASDYLPNLSGFKKVEVVERQIRNYPGIRWVLVREYQKRNSQKNKRVA